MKFVDIDQLLLVTRDLGRQSTAPLKKYDIDQLLEQMESKKRINKDRKGYLRFK